MVSSAPASVEELRRELRPPLSSAEALVEADRCLYCVGPYAEAPCAAACPAEIDVPGFIGALAEGDREGASDCPLGWGHEPRLGNHILDTAVETLFWPLYEVVDGRYRLTYRPERPLPIEKWLEGQKRFAHLLKPEDRPFVERIQAQVTADWRELLTRCDEGGT